MASNVNPTVRRRRLGQELRRLREVKGMTAEEVAERLLVSQSKISRLENGRRSISQRDVRDLCGVYEVEDQRIVESLMQMAKDSRQQGWWHAFGDIPYSVYIGLETDAESLRVYEPQMVPGLLQTRAYAEYRIFSSLARFAEHVEAATVSLATDTGGHGVFCAVVVKLVSGSSVRLTARGRHAYDAVNRVAHRLGHALERHVEPTLAASGPVR